MFLLKILYHIIPKNIFFISLSTLVQDRHYVYSVFSFKQGSNVALYLYFSSKACYNGQITVLLVVLILLHHCQSCFCLFVCYGHTIKVMCLITDSKHSHCYILLNRGRGGAVPPPPPGRGAVVPRGTVGTRASLPTAILTRGVSAPRARGTAGTPGYRAPLLQASHKTYDDYVSTTSLSLSCLFLLTFLMLQHHHLMDVYYVYHYWH